MNPHKKFSISFALLLAALLATSQLAFAQSASNVKTSGPSAEVLTLNLKSPAMGREVPYRVVLPLDYKTKPDARYGVVYLLHGLTGHFDNWTDKTRLAEYVANHQFIIVTPEGANGWYTDSVTTPNDKYETYIVNDLIPEIDKKYRTLANRENRYIAGLSMGGYGAIKFGLKYPTLFSVVGSFSGALGAAAYNETNAGSIGKTLTAVFGPDNSDTRRANDIFPMVRALEPDRIKQLPFIYQSCGTEDFLISNNWDFVALLVEKKIPHEYRQHPGAHTWDFWDTHVREFLALVSRRSKK